MKHEVFLPLGVKPLRAALADPTTVTRSVPGFQQDAGDAPGTGRLKFRAGGTTITYRGAFRIGDPPEDPGDPEGVTFRAEGTEVRGTGTADVTVTVTLTPAGEGTTAAFTVTGSGDGRAAELDAQALESAGVRLLNRFAEALTAVAGPDSGAGAYDGDDLSADAETDAPPAAPDPEFVDVEPSTWADGDGPDGPDGPDGMDGTDAFADTEPDAEDEPDAGTAEDTDGVDEVPEDQGIEAVEAIEGIQAAAGVEGPEGGDGIDGGASGEGVGSGESVGSAEGLDVAHADVPPVEAAHARRTMIGRSAEEVDHAPPRGRYAPVPAPEATAQGATLRWAAPAAALAVATAIVVGRALRRRR
ncbi:carbon monoxide dehydrogenase [Streptomyces sp. NPDC059578]|uniref:carbon monoxide dehydrogenase n=1 Tax=Streptomyces sp. NPDC059578 TaxID=3346874 RepID=UPI00367F1EDB